MHNAHSHPMKCRILWTWDSWVCDPFSADSFVSEYAKLIDFAAASGYNGIIIWGFIDSRHGGVEAAKRVATYGSSRGVRILPGLGAGGYGGFSTTPDTPFNLETYLREHPELRAVARYTGSCEDGVGCLYQEPFQKWLRDGARWLAETFDIGGVNIETNEMDLIDVCEHAREATRQEPNRLRYAASYSDLALAVPLIYEQVKAARPDAWVTYATYEPAWFDRQEDLWLLESMPADAIAQWNMELGVRERVPPPVENSVSLIHSGGWSYHLAAFPPIWSFTQFRCFYPVLEEAQKFARNQHAMNMDGFVLGNVGSPAMPDNEVNYLAYLEFSRNPELTMEEFGRTILADLYGRGAVDAVLELMLAQPEVHRATAPIWRGWAWLLFHGEVRDRLLPADQRALDLLDRQIQRAERAAGLAETVGGEQRLRVILEVLREYRAVAELSCTPSLETWIPRQRDLSVEEVQELDRQVARLAEEAGLPEDIYCYTPQRREWSTGYSNA